MGDLLFGDVASVRLSKASGTRSCAVVPDVVGCGERIRFIFVVGRGSSRPPRLWFGGAGGSRGGLNALNEES